MQRVNSKCSVSSVGSSRTTEKRTKPTHMIIRRECDKSLVVLPVTNLVNGASARMKVNDKATFKSDLGDRKQERGTIILFGSEEVCMDQLQVFDWNHDDQENICFNHEHARPPPLQRGTNSSIIFESAIISANRTGSSTTTVTSKTINSGPVNQSSLEDKWAKKKNEKITYNVHNKKKIAYSSTIDEETGSIGSTEKSVSSDRAVFNGVHESTKAVDIEDSSHSFKKNHSIGYSLTRKENLSPSITMESSDDDISDSPRNDGKQGRMNSAASNPARIDHSIDSLKNVFSASEEYLSKKCKKLTKENLLFQAECDRLKKENYRLKKTTIPMPDQNARQWFVQIAKLFSNKCLETDVFKYAGKLGVHNPEDLISCLQDTTSNTARRIIRMLYSPSQLMRMSGTEIPAAQRQAIREFAELHRGPISNRKFNEAINGVFRSKKQQNDAQSTAKINEHSKPLNNVQKTIRQIVNERSSEQSNQKDMIDNNESFD